MARAILILLSLFLIGYLLSGKPLTGTRGSITGVVCDSSGAAVIGAVVKVAGTRLGGLSKGPDGRFTIAGVQAGDHVIEVSAPGSARIERKVRVADGTTTDIGVVTLARGRVHEQGVAISREERLVRVASTESEVAVIPASPGAEYGDATSGVGRASVLSKSHASTGRASNGNAYIGGFARESSVLYPTVSTLALQDEWNVDGDADAQPRSDSIDRSGERYETIYENPFISPLIQRFSTFSIDVDAASYSLVRSFLSMGQRPPRDAVRIEELVNYFDYSYPEPADEHPFSLVTEISDCPWNREHRLVQVAIQGRRLDLSALPPANLVFLIDVSGSMQSLDKLPLVKRAFRLLVEQLRPEDKVAIAVYAGAAGLVLPPTSGSDRGAILAAIDGLEAGGSTAGGAGIVLAYETARRAFLSGGNNRVILATDGDFNVGISDDESLVRLIEEKRGEGIFLTVLGFGTGNYQDAKMEKLADKGNGNYSYIDNLFEARKVFVNELGATLQTLAKDVKIQLELDPARVREYRLIGYENRMLAREDFDDDRKDAGELGAGHSVTALYEIVPTEAASTGEWRGRPDTLDMPDGQSDAGLMQVRLRYKLPHDTTSRLIERAVFDRSLRLTQASENFRFAAAVAEFGMILRDSRHKGGASVDEVLRLADGARSVDPFGYRSEFLDLVRKLAAM